MSSPPRLTLPDGLELRPSTTRPPHPPSQTRPSPAMASATVAHTSKSTKSRFSTQAVASPPAAVQPTTRQPVALQPTTRQQTVGQPTTRQQTIGQPMTRQPVAVQPTTRQQTVGQPTTRQQTVGQPTTRQQPVGQPTIRQPTAGQPTARQPVVVQPTTRQPVAEQPTTRQPVAGQPTTRQQAAEQLITRQPVVGQPTTRQPVVGQPTTRQPTAGQPTTRQPVAIQPTTQPAAVQPARRQPAVGQPTTRQPVAIQPTAATAPQPAAGQPTTTQPGSTPLTTHPAGIQPPWPKSARRENEPVPKKRRLLEATEAADGHEMTKTGTKQGDAEDILARVCSAVGIDSDLVESVVDDPSPNHQSEVVGSTHSVPGNLHYLRGVRPLQPGIPPAHRLRRPELRLHSTMHPAYRITPDGSYALAEFHPPYQQYHHRPHDPAYMVPHRIAIHPGEPHHYRPFPHYLNRYQYVGPVSQPMTRPPVLRPGLTMGPPDPRLPAPHGSPNLPQPADLRHYPPPALHHSPPGPPALRHDPRRGPQGVHHVPHTVPDIKHIHPGHSEIPIGIPTSRHDSSSMPPSASEHSAPTATNRSFASSQSPLRPGLQGCADQQKQHAGMHEVCIPTTSVSAHHPQSSPYPVSPHHGHGQYRHPYPRVSESYPKHPYNPQAQPVRDSIWQETTSSRVPVISSRTSPDNSLRTSVPARSPYIPEQMQSYGQTWGVKRPSDDSDRPSEVVQIRRTMEPPKPCVELIPIGPPRDTRGKKSVDEDSHNSSGSVMQQQSGVAPEPRQQRVNTSSSQHTQFPGRTLVNIDQKALIAAHGHSAHRQTLAAYIAQAASLQHNHHQGRLPITSTTNPEVPFLTDHPGAFRRPIFSYPLLYQNSSRASSRGEAPATGAQKGQRYNRSNSEPSCTQSKTYNDRCDTYESKTDSRFSTHKYISNVDDAKKQTTASRTSTEEKVPQVEIDLMKTNARRISTPESDISVEKAVHFTNRNGDLKDNAQNVERGHELHQKPDLKKTETEACGLGPGQLHRLHSSRYVTHHRPASEPPLGLLSATNNAISSVKRPASLPSAGQQAQHNPTAMRCQNDLVDLTFHQDQDDAFSQKPTEADNDEVFMGRLKLVLNDLLSVPEATKLQQLSCSTGQLLASVVQRGGAHPSKDLSPRKRLREDFKTVVKLCLPSNLLKCWGWDSCTPEQILDQLIKVTTHNGDDSVNGSVICSTPSSPLTHDDVLEDDVFSPPPCDAPRQLIPGTYIHTTHVPEPPHDRVSHGPHTRAVQPCAYTTTTYTMHHHVPVSYVPTARVMPPHAPHSIPACSTSLHSHVIPRPSDPHSAQVYTTGREEHPSSNQGKNPYPPPPHQAQHTAVKWPGSNSVVGSSVHTPVNAEAPAT